MNDARKGQVFSLPSHCPEKDENRQEYPLMNPVYNGGNRDQNPGSERVLFYWTPGTVDSQNVPIAKYCGIITHVGVEVENGVRNGFNMCPDQSEEDKKRKEEEKKRLEEEERKRKEAEETKGKEGEEKKRKEEEDNKKTSRNKVCLALTAVDVAADTFNPEDLTEAAKVWPADVPYVEGELTESNIMPKNQELKKEPATVSGYPISPLIGAFTPNPLKRSPAKSGGGPRRGGQGPTGADGKPVKPADKGSVKSKETIEGFKKQKAYTDCLTRTAGTKTDAGAELKLDGVPPGGFIADDAEEMITVRLCGRGGCALRELVHEHSYIWGSYPDAMFRPGRIEMNKCIYVGKDLDKQVSAFEVTGGCCVFYRDGECKAENSIFSAVGREDMDLEGDHNDAISSFMCNHDLCKGIPASA
ncbi:MAG: hypothetical protein Q9177_003104 [Variospora cf. flavescens]